MLIMLTKAAILAATLVGGQLAAHCPCCPECCATTQCGPATCPCDECTCCDDCSTCPVTHAPARGPRACSGVSCSGK
jgi:hypothetical protein